MADFENLAKTSDIKSAIREVGRSWTSNSPDDREVKEIFAIARQIERHMPGNRLLSTNELAAAACHEYFSS